MEFPFKGECNICGSPDVSLVKDRFGYRYICDSCGAYVGCHPGTIEPLGILADEEMRNLRIRCHKAFDKRWDSNKERREQYGMLADSLGISSRECHFGMMDKAMLRKALALMEKE